MDKEVNHSRFITASVKGANHADKGISCEDAGMSATLYHKGYQFYFMAVADGHGGESYIRSDIGSFLAIQAASESANRFIMFVIDAYEKYPDSWVEMVKEDFTTRFGKILVNNWIRMVEAHANDPNTETDEIIKEKLIQKFQDEFGIAKEPAEETVSHLMGILDTPEKTNTRKIAELERLALQGDYNVKYKSGGEIGIGGMGDQDRDFGSDIIEPIIEKKSGWKRVVGIVFIALIIGVAVTVIKDIDLNEENPFKNTSWRSVNADIFGAFYIIDFYDTEYKIMWDLSSSKPNWKEKLGSDIKVRERGKYTISGNTVTLNPAIYQVGGGKIDKATLEKYSRIGTELIITGNTFTTSKKSQEFRKIE